ncbi:hypothetical protein ACLX1H_011128 [Fusarium chlamydosporum]
MSDSNKNVEKGTDRPLSEETREDLRRMTLGLTNQRTIDTLTRTGMMAKIKRESSRALRDEAIARAEAEKEAAAKKAEDEQKKLTMAENNEKAVDKVDRSKRGVTESEKNKKKQI